MLELIFQGFAEWAYELVLECWEYFSSALLDIMSMDYAYMKSHVPVMDNIIQVLMAVGWALLIGNLIFQAIKSMMSGLGFEGEDPKLLFARTFVFSFLLLASPQICEIGLSITARIIDLLQIPTAVHVTLVDKSVFGALTASWLLVIIFGIIIIFKTFKLLLEIAERYVILAVLTMTAPLAFAMGGSRSTSDIFSGWCRMYGSMCLLMVTNVIFFKMLLSVLATVPSGLDVFPWIVLILTIVKVAQKADGIITRIGLNPAITGDSLGRPLPGALTYLIVRTATSRITKAVGRSAGSGGRGTHGMPPGGGDPRMGGPLGGGGYGGTARGFYQKARPRNAQSDSAQSFASRGEPVRADGAQKVAQEVPVGFNRQSSSVIRQSSFRETAERNGAAPRGKYHVPNPAPTASRIIPTNGAQAPAGERSPTGAENPSAAMRQQAGGGVPSRSEFPTQRASSERRSRAVGHGPAGTQAQPSSARISQVSTQRVQNRVNGGPLQRTEQNENVMGQIILSTAQIAVQKPPSAAAGSIPAASVGGQPKPQQPAQTRYTQRPAQGATAVRQTVLSTEPSHTGSAGTPPSSPKQASVTEPRLGRNVFPSGTAPSAQARQHSPARQEPRPAGNRSVPPTRGQAYPQHHGSAGSGEKGRDKTAARPAASASALMPKADSLHGIARTPSATTIKGNGKKSENATSARRQRGKKYDGEG